MHFDLVCGYGSLQGQKLVRILKIAELTPKLRNQSFMLLDCAKKSLLAIIDNRQEKVCQTQNLVNIKTKIANPCGSLIWCLNIVL